MLKVDIINNAYAEIRVSGLTSNPTPEDLEYALIKLEDMASEFEDIRNICLGYVYEDYPDPNTEIGVPRWARQAMATNLAIRLLAAFGKEIPQSLMGQASQSMSAISGKAITVREVQYPTRQPRGSGDTHLFARWSRFYRANPFAPVTCETKQIVRGETNNYSTSFADYLEDGELISSYTTKNSGGLTVTDKVLDVDLLTYTVACSTSAEDLEVIEFTVTTSDGRVKPFVINFNVTGETYVISSD